MMRTKERAFLLSYYPGSLQDLPLTSPLAVQAANLAQSRKLTEAELIAALRSDIFLCTKLVSVANSIFFNFSHTPCFTVEDALSRLGHDFAVALLKNAEQISDPLANEAARKLWVHSSATALIARELRRYTSTIEHSEETIYWISMIHDIGLLIEANFEQQGFASVLDALQEREQIDDDHCALSQALAHYWSLPAWVKDLLRWHHAPEECPDETLKPLLWLLHIADLVVNLKDDELVPTVFGKAGLSPSDVARVVERRPHLLASIGMRIR